MRSLSRLHPLLISVIAMGCAFVGFSPIPVHAANTVPATFTISGSGWGHGIGMSQYGAFGMAIDYSLNPSKVTPSCGSVNNDAQQACLADVIAKNYYPGATVSEISDSETPGLSSGIRVGLKQDEDVLYIRGEQLKDSRNVLAGGNLDVDVYDSPTHVKQTVSNIAANTIVTFTHSSATAKMAWGTTVVSGSKFVVKWNRTPSNGNKAGLLHLERSTLDSNGEVNTTKTEAMADAWCPSATRDVCHRYKYGSMEIAFGAFGKNEDNSLDTVKDFNVVNTLRLSDEYLYGLGEMPSSWFHYVTSGNVELNTSSALQAQTIAARTYALQKVRAQTSSDPKSVRAACQCHVYASTNDQAFIGYVKEASYRGDKWVAAVNATRDSSTASLANVNQRKWKVLTYNNAPIQAYFSSSTGGYSQPVSEVWGSTQSAFPYLVKADDRWALDSRTGNPYAHWSVQISQGTLVAQLNKFLGSQGEITDIASMSIAGKTDSGSIAKLIIVDSVGTPRTINVRPKSHWISGEWDITPDNIRSLIGKSNLIPIANSGFNGSTYLTTITNGSSTTNASPSTKSPKLVSVTGTSWPKTLKLGQTYTVTGTISPVQAGVRVTLQRKLATGWSALNTSSTNSSGQWTLTWTAPTGGSYVLRAEAANSRNSVHGNNHPVTVAAQLTMKAPAKVTSKSAITFTGALSPARPHITVVVERKTKSGTWSAFCSGKTDATGQWKSSRLAPQSHGSITFRARIANAQLGNPVSASVSVTVR